MTFNIITPDTRLKAFHAGRYQGRRSGVTKGTAIADLIALERTVCLCIHCESKFNATGNNYIQARRAPLNRGAIGKCDGCRTWEDCKVFVPLTSDDAKGMDLCA